MTTLVERLRARVRPSGAIFDWEPDKDCREAAAEIERLRAALTEIAGTRIPGGGLAVDAHLVHLAMAALEGK
jgi:hypothetical protein